MEEKKYCGQMASMAFSVQFSVYIFGLYTEVYYNSLVFSFVFVIYS